MMMLYSCENGCEFFGLSILECQFNGISHKVFSMFLTVK